MRVTRDLIERLEAVEAEVDARLARALATLTGNPGVEVHPLAQGVLVATGRDRYVNRAVGVTTAALTASDVADVVAWYGTRGLTPAVQLSSWAPAETVASLASHTFVPTGSRSVLVRGTAPVDAPDDVLVVEVDDVTATDARDVMAGDTADRWVSDEFMTADRAAEGTVQLLALHDGRPVGCGSVTVVRTGTTMTAWLGAARTVPSARRRGVQTALVAHRVGLARSNGCDLVGATATAGSDSARNLQRLGFALVQDQWVVERPAL